MEFDPHGLFSIPIATYRLQFNGDFGFAAARRILPYLHDLGISHIYASPYFKARAGSRHGYDITDHNSLNPEVGSWDEYEALTGEMRKLGMGQILDIVPNHMCVESSDNAWWMDVLENGPSSNYAPFFDIYWKPVKRELKNKVLIPVLGDQYGAVLENGELRLVFEDGAFSLRFYEHKFPIIPKTYVSILSCRLEEPERILGAENPVFQELLSIITSLEHLPPPTETDPGRIAERYREKEVAKRRLRVLCEENGVIRDFVEANVLLFNGTRGDPRSFDHLDELLRQQVHRLSHWRVATEEINYRRFFDINSLGAIRMEDQRVFEETHRLIFRLVRERKVTGLRVDHLDGLYDPYEYLGRLQRGCFINGMPQRRPAGIGRHAAKGQRVEVAFEDIEKKYLEILEEDPRYKAFFIVGEKILTKGEKLPAEWPVIGTTGYWFLNVLNGLFVDTANARQFDAIYSRFAQNRQNFPDIVYEKKKLVMQVAMSSEINTLANYLNTISEKNRHTRDFALNSLIKALAEVIAFFPIYRTYTNSFVVSERDCQYIDQAVSKALRRNPATNASIFEFIRDVLKLRFYGNLSDEDRSQWLDFVMRFQQITGPVMAKGFEDTAFYVYNRLVSLNEVGGAPERFGASVDTFHGQNIERLKFQPLAMLAGSTHDTKRSEDVRARINVLSEIPDVWRRRLLRWGAYNAKSKAVVDGVRVPDRNEEYLLYQTLVGSWPLENGTAAEFAGYRQRIKDYMLKAVREAKVNSSWINPDTAYEEAVVSFVEWILDDTRQNRFLDDFMSFHPLISDCGMFNSLSQTLLKMTSPGIPDFYQGSELWDLKLVDPDNRRPVDFELRVRLLDGLKDAESSINRPGLARRLVETRQNGMIKLFLIKKTLEFRGRSRRLFESGGYLPLETRGEKADNLCAFERSLDGELAIVVAPRFYTRLTGETGGLPLGEAAWRNTAIVLPINDGESAWMNVFTGETAAAALDGGVPVLFLSGILACFPVALLVKI